MIAASCKNACVDIVPSLKVFTATSMLFLQMPKILIKFDLNIGPL